MKKKNITVEMIDDFMKKMDCSYEEAREALMRATDEETTSKSSDSSDFIENVVEFVKEMVKKGNVTKIKIQKNGEDVVTIPLNVGVIGAVFAFYPTLAGIAVAVSTGHSISLEKVDGSTVEFDEVKQYAKQAVKKAAETGSEVYDKVKDNIDEEKVVGKFNEIKDKVVEKAKDIKGKKEEVEEEVVEEIEEKE